MALQDVTPRIGLFMLLAFGITILLIKAGVSFWNHNYSIGLVCLGVGTVLSFTFFRKRKLALGIIALAFLLVNAGAADIFHPTPLAILVTIASGAGIIVLVRWGTAKYPNLKGQDWKQIFDKRP